MQLTTYMINRIMALFIGSSLKKDNNISFNRWVSPVPALDKRLDLDVNFKFDKSWTWLNYVLEEIELKCLIDPTVSPESDCQFKNIKMIDSQLFSSTDINGVYSDAFTFIKWYKSLKNGNSK